MDISERIVKWIEGGEKDCLYDLISDSVCGNCDAPVDCLGCNGCELITKVENQIMKYGLEYMKLLAKDWIRNSTN